MSFADRQFDYIPDGTCFVIELCGSEEHGDEFVHAFLEFPNGQIIDFGVAPRLPCVPGNHVTAVPALRDLMRSHRRLKMMTMSTSRRGLTN